MSCLAEYDDKSPPLRDFITGWAVQWLGGIKLKQRRNVRGQPRSRPERIRLTLPDILEGLAYMGEATAGALLDDVAIAWLKHDGSYVVDPQMKERLAAYRVRVEAKNVELAAGARMYEIRMSAPQRSAHREELAPTAKHTGRPGHPEQP